METLDDLLEWLHGSSGLACAIFDATNTTRARRRAVLEKCAAASPPITLIFLESKCDDERILKQNYAMKLINDDYKGASSLAERQRALDDFLERVAAYEKVYEPITDDEVVTLATAQPELPPMRYLQTVDAGKRLVASQMDGDSLVCNWLLQLMHTVHLSPRTLHIVLCGQSINDRDGIRGGDSPLSPEGLQYAQALAERLKQRYVQMGDEQRPPLVMTGTLQRYTQMGETIGETLRRGWGTPPRVVPSRALNELCFGSLEELRVGRLRDSFPHEWQARELDRLNYRYPGVGGQSYFDLIQSMRQVVLAIEASRRDAVVICDVAVARVLLGYFTPTPLADIPELPAPAGIIELSRTHAGFKRSDTIIREGALPFLATLR